MHGITSLLDVQVLVLLARRGVLGLSWNASQRSNSDEMAAVLHVV